MKWTPEEYAAILPQDYSAAFICIVISTTDPTQKLRSFFAYHFKLTYKGEGALVPKGLQKWC